MAKLQKGSLRDETTDEIVNGHGIDQNILDATRGELHIELSIMFN